MTQITRRIDGLREAMARRDLQGFYTEDPVNIRYLTGFFAPESALVLAGNQAVFVTDFRTLEDGRNRLPGFLLAEVDQGAGTLEEACARLEALGPARIGFESHLLSYETGRAFVEKVGAGRAVAGYHPISGVPLLLSKGPAASGL